MSTLLSTSEIAALFSVTETTIKRWADEGQIACVKTLGGHRKFLMKEVIRFGENHGYPLTGTIPPTMSSRKLEKLEFSVETRNYKKISEIFLEEALDVDKQGLFDLLSYLYKHHISFSTIGDEVIRPAMVRIGELWAEGKLEVNKEHLASQAVLEILIRLGPQLHHKPSNGMSAVCASAEGDYHEIGLRILAYVLESEGWSVHYVGANTPFDTLGSLIKANTPELICLSFTLEDRPEAFFDNVRSLGKLARSYNATYVVGGFFAGNHSEKDFQCDYISSSAHDAVAFLRDKFQLKPGPKKTKQLHADG